MSAADFDYLNWKKWSTDSFGATSHDDDAYFGLEVLPYLPRPALGYWKLDLATGN